MTFKTDKEAELDTSGDQNNYYASLVQGQKIARVSTFTLESGVSLDSVPVAYSTWGALNEEKHNVLVICHALTGSSDAVDWWRPLIGPGKALDYSRYLIFCANVLGSPYGSASPLSMNPETGGPYGPSFPETTIRDDVRMQKLVLDTLGVQGVAVVIGGSMGGMTTLEWPLCTPPGYVKNIVPIATSADHGAWGISWGETQRQAIYSDSTFDNGWYKPVPEGQPRMGLGTARTIAMLTYRSQGSFESRFGRKRTIALKSKEETDSLPTPPPSHRGSMSDGTPEPLRLSPTRFSSQNYLQYQANKFLSRFDANCYIHLTKKMDSHDVTQGRLPQRSDSNLQSREKDLQLVLGRAPPNALVISVESDILFRPEQQRELARCLPDAKFVSIESPDGHDGFLLEFDTLNDVIVSHLKDCFPSFYTNESECPIEAVETHADKRVHSVFGEAETVDF
ncbi:homoserine O-acetyltransferase [Lophiostoma macrostomum CBS 122681]|uniref:Homoserine O-acetyltransferase n=1 Tax=Lophiostoma macrostomum CBS 122681 TaxID=1314788 RepID=A0A6A6TL86_9PLEO|nr:homoserine O-acetyltransferase [Lophiostoma macrostomum CBS 122681]